MITYQNCLEKYPKYIWVWLVLFFLINKDNKLSNYVAEQLRDLPSPVYTENTVNAQKRGLLFLI